MDADLDTLLIALYVELVDHIIPGRNLRTGRGPGRPPLVTDAEIVCLAVAQVLLRFYDERHWMRAARSRVGHLFPRLLEQSEYNERVKQAGPLMEAAVRWLAEHNPRHRRAVAADGRHPDRLRAVDDHRAAVEPVRVGRLRLRVRAQPLVLGCKTPAAHHR